MNFKSQEHYKAWVDVCANAFFFLVCIGILSLLFYLLKSLLAIDAPPSKGDFGAGLVGGILFGLGFVWVKNRLVESWGELENSIELWMKLR